MIEIDVFRNVDGSIVGFTVGGHAGASMHGHDIVCAAVSAVTQTALLGVNRHLKRGGSFKVAAGDLQVFLDGAPDELTDAVLESMLLGLVEIAKINPKCVRISAHRR